MTKPIFRASSTAFPKLFADTCYQIAITTNEKAYKTENHPYIVRLYGKRAEIAQALGKAEEAEAFKKSSKKLKKPSKEIKQNRKEMQNGSKK